MRSQKLKNCLERIPKIEMRDATQRIAGEGAKVNGAIKKIFSACKNKDFLDKTRSVKLLHCLNRIPRRTRDASQRIIGGGVSLKASSSPQ